MSAPERGPRMTTEEQPHGDSELERDINSVAVPSGLGAKAGLNLPGLMGGLGIGGGPQINSAASAALGGIIGTDILGKIVGQGLAGVGTNWFPTYRDVLGVGTATVIDLLRSRDLLETRSRKQDFAVIEPEPSSYSDRLKSPADYFADSEGEIRSMDDLHRAIRVLTDKAQSVPLVWRGQQRADWGMHSSLFIALMKQKKVRPPQRVPKGVQPFPTEDDMIAAEKSILRVARESWRFNGLSALEIFARLQHQGAPTRLLDVSRNPYIAAWFAVEASELHDEQDGRLLALATTPVPRPNEVIHNDDLFLLLSASPEPFWHGLQNSAARQEADWGTGANRRVWIPPEYDPRIAAQNAAFVLDGVPMISSRTSSYFKSNDGHYWSKADLLASSSIYARMLSTTRKPIPNAPSLAPTFSFRILKEAKTEIRQMMERWFGYSRATIYPDIGGLATHIKSNFASIVGDGA